MKRDLQNHSTAHYRFLSLILATSLALPLHSLAASVALATSPLATSTTSTVQPNLLFVLDNSGSMAWEHMPDDAGDSGSSVTFSYGYYGLRSSQCNQVYYDPSITYNPPVYADGTNYPDATFTAALPNGYQAAGTTIVAASSSDNYTNTAVNLGTSFKASLPATYTSVAGDTLAQSAYYYNYSGTQTTLLQKNYHSTTNPFYIECHDSTGGSVSAIAPVNGVKALVGGAPTTVGSGVFTKTRLATTKTTTITVSGSTATTTSVSSITVNGVELMSGTSTTSTTINTVATNIAAKITLNGFSATASSSTITITGPASDTTYTASVANYTPVITKSGSMTLTADVFPDITPAKLTNFANWYSYYRTRMLMMKTATGRAFASLNNNYRVGLMKINTSTAPALAMGTFESTQRTNWYSTLYGTTPTSSTPLREALSNAGKYYAGKMTGYLSGTATDPVQYSCQQNFTILSTDGYWNGNAGFKLDGTAVGNQDGAVGRPMHDGTTVSGTFTNTYTRNDYSSSGTKISTGTNCTSPKKRLLSQPQICSCTVTSAGADCASACSSSSTDWSNNGSKVYVAPYTSSSSTCTSTVTLPSPDPSTRVLQSSVVNTSGGSSDTLADVAMYYYQTDLRTSTLGSCTSAAGEELCTNNVFIGGNDNNLQQHMTTFTLGLGASGRMNYSSSYLNDSSGDYVAVKLASTADSTESPPICSWQANGTNCVWPVPGDGLIENIDDLWHAAVNGRGAYFSATNPTSLSEGLSSALAGINTRRGAAAAAATSTLNPVAGNNFAYVASYTTVAWKGNLEARGINTDTGVVSENATWCVENVVADTCAAPGTVVAETIGDTTIYNCVTTGAVICTGGVLDGTDCKIPVATACTGTMNAKVSDTSDTRTIKTANSTGTALINFDAAYATANPTYFDSAQISTLSQWSSLTPAQQTAAAGVNLVNYLRGQYGYEDRTANAVDNRLYRYREAVLGDALESQPAFISKPVFSYPYAGYTEYKTAQAGRAGIVYMGANDGMMHAFDAGTGVESWAYVPSMVIPNMWKLADANYATLHRNFVNGSPVTSDICTANCSNSATAVWKTILVAGLSGGGRGYYALDITNPSSPVLLWEFTITTGIGAVKNDDVGYGFGKPIITRKADGTWVVLVTSGYNNISPGSGQGYLYVLNANTGAIISKIATGAGDMTTPSGLAKIAAWNDEPAGNQAGYVYGGDLLGNLWRFDINSATAAAIGTGAAMKLAALYSDTSGTLPQPITTTPVLGKIVDKRVVFVGTGKYLEIPDLTTTQTQTLYAIKDDNATTTLVNPRTALVQQTLGNNPDGTATRLTTSSNAVDFYTDRGWYLDFPDSGERVNIDSLLVQGTLLVATIVPSNTACSPGGYGWLNFVDYKTGKAVDTATNLVSQKSDATIVGINIMYIGGNPVPSIVTSNDPTPKQPGGVTFGASAAGFTGKRVIWRELIP